MSKNLFFLISFVVVAGLVGSAAAVDKTWLGTDNNWFNPNNWSPVGVPTGGYDPCSGDIVHINGQYDGNSVTNYPVINTTDPCAWCRKLQLGTVANSGEAYLTIQDGGELTVRSYDLSPGNQTIVLGQMNGTHGILTMTGGTINMTQGERMEIGGRYSSGNGTFNMTGGQFNNGDLRLPGYSGTGEAILNLDGGVIDCNTIEWPGSENPAKGTLNIYSGTLICDFIGFKVGLRCNLYGGVIDSNDFKFYNPAEEDRPMLDIYDGVWINRSQKPGAEQGRRSSWDVRYYCNQDPPTVVACGGRSAVVIECYPDPNMGRDQEGDWPGFKVYADADFDGDPDCTDPDDDNDGILDGDDNCPYTSNRGQEDSDADGLGNLCDNCPDTPNPVQADSDGDGVGDDCDNCPSTPNADQADCDGDGEADACEADPGDQDVDGDGVCNGVDNCLYTFNPGQEDSDGDGIGNACEMQAICVPWQPSNPSIPHYTYDGAEITLKGIVRFGAEYRWDFGDGASTAWTAVANPYNLGVKHVYNGAVGQMFIATLYVRDGSGNEDQDEYLVKIHESSDLSIAQHLDVRINMAIDEGLWYLHTQMIRATCAAGSPGYRQPYGYWSDSYTVAAVGTAVDAFQLHGSKANMDYNNDPYVETVQRALNYLLYNTYAFNIGVQSAGDPDTNGNGIGLVTNQSSDLHDSRQTYIGGICMTAFASSGAPNKIASVGRANVKGRTYAEIAQDMVDFFAWGQVDSGSGRGGWRYYANYGNSDMSTTQWPPQAMLTAEQNMGSTVPQFVRDELILFLDYTQNNYMDHRNGGFGYSDPGQMLNITKQGAGIICHEFLGTPLTDPKVEKAFGFVYRHWNDTGTCWDYTKLHGNSYGMYALMKACRIPEPDITQITEYDYTAGQQTQNNFDWYYTPAGQSQQGLASYCVSTQQADGSWDDTVGCNKVYNAFCTGWRILVLLKGVTIIPPEAAICDCDEQEYNLNQDIHLDGSCSYHPDITRTIVSYEWDFDYDGVFVADATGVEAIIPGGYPETGLHPVALRVTDDNPDYLGDPQTDIYVCDVDVHEPPHCPHAFADGPYIGWIGVPVTLDASTSWDPDNEIVSYEWDLDNDGLFGTEDNDCFGESSDAVGINPAWTWYAPYLGVIGLRVTDAPGEIEGIHFEPCPDIDYTTVEIGNHAPECDPGGPYTASPGYTITLDGTSSFDPDPGDEISSFAWDFDNDGEFDDSYEAQPEFTVGPDIGMVYDICLKVTDNFGKYSIYCTTVKIVPNQPPVADAGPDQIVECACNTAEGTKVTLDGTGSYDTDGDPLTYTWTGPFIESPATGGATPTVTLLDGCPGNYIITLVINDGIEDSESDDVLITVMDTIAPVISNVDVDYLLAAVGQTVNFSADVFDECDSSVDVECDFGDGTAQSSNPAYAYGQPGIYTVTLTATDDCGNATTDSIIVVVYDPVAGFTTGGGWFVPDSDSFIDGVGVIDTVSKANFGFIVKYKKGADNPDGNLEFQYKAGDINLRSTDMEWLVVQSTTKVRFKGKATINGQGSYTFKVTAEDNGEPGTGDWFKIEIWIGPDVDTENSPPTPKHKAQGYLGGGNIQIHQK